MWPIGLRGLFFALLVCLVSWTPANAADRCPYATEFNHISCRAESLSWVQVRFFGGDVGRIVGKREADYASDIRGYAQREMPTLQQESIQPTGTYFVNSQIGRERVDLPTKTALYCNLGAAEEQEEEVAAIYIRCEMYTFREIARGMQPSYYDASLGIATSDTVAAAIDERLEYLVTSLGARFYRDMNEMKQESDEAR